MELVNQDEVAASRHFRFLLPSCPLIRFRAPISMATKAPPDTEVTLRGNSRELRLPESVIS